MTTIDLRKLDTDFMIEADLCIVGTGVAGIFVAREFVGTAIRLADHLHLKLSCCISGPISVP